MPCTSCGSEKKFARGLCSGCYHRLRRRGTVARKNTKNIGFSCSTDGCDQPADVKGYCSYHYQRQLHPLRNTWKLIRNRYGADVPKEWDSFDRFLAAVGERPTSNHQLRRIDDAKPYSVTNVRWVRPVARRTDCYSKTDRAAYAKEWALQNKYNITGEDYQRMLAAQGGKCAICEDAGSVLHVDHCHAQGDVRGLLCVRCNRMLGYARDKITTLERAAAYLVRSRQ